MDSSKPIDFLDSRSIFVDFDQNRVGMNDNRRLRRRFFMILNAFLIDIKIALGVVNLLTRALILPNGAVNVRETAPQEKTIFEATPLAMKSARHNSDVGIVSNTDYDPPPC